jgi:hypothetical protein
VTLIEWVMVGIAAAAFGLIVWHERRTQRAIADRGRWIDEEREARIRREAYIERVHQQYLDDMREALRAERERTAPDYLGFARTLVTGSPTVQEAQSFQTLEPEVRARMDADQKAIERGINDLRQAYESSGLRVPTDDELRAEVEAIMRGEPPKVVS